MRLGKVGDAFHLLCRTCRVFTLNKLDRHPPLQGLQGEGEGWCFPVFPASPVLGRGSTEVEPRTVPLQESAIRASEEHNRNSICTPGLMFPRFATYRLILQAPSSTHGG